MAHNFSPAMNWYRCVISGLNLPDETSVSPPLDPKLYMPVLYVESSHDPISGGERAIQGMQALIADLTVKKVASGHWVQLEKAAEVNTILEEWVQSVDAKAKAEM
jgi:soluble epoxide hydrolase / lipid-phosphate phosphatase